MKYREIKSSTGTDELKKLDKVYVADSYAYSIHLSVIDKCTGFGGVSQNSPWEAVLAKTQTGGYQNGPWPKDDKKVVPLGHIKTIMEYEGLNFKNAIQTQFSGMDTFLIGEEIFSQLEKAGIADEKKIRSKVADALQEAGWEDLIKIAELLKVKL